MVTSSEQGRETRGRLMAAAVELIVEHGWGAVTTRMVAERAGLRPGLVHYHFRSVTDLLIDASMQVARTEFEAVMAGITAMPGPEAMAQMLRAIAGYGSTDPATVAVSEMLLAATRLERLRVELRGLVTEARTLLADWLRDQGVADPEATAVFTLAAIDGLILHRMIDPTLGAVDVSGPLLRAAGIAERLANEGVSDDRAAEGERTRS
ncbi:TetR/AcrR family transcriptional regulator [Nocardia sp. NPDC049149]|uniref:TetR/AcrR family transcriptional regulator n=1 Tax=Nocardia sp. NPDC049149 TaxID=3364315 RepID=UPI0037237D09